LTVPLRTFTQQQQQIALHSAGVLKLVDQQQLDARRGGARDVGVVA